MTLFQTKIPKTRKPIYVGIDYSMTSPSICISETATPDVKFEACRFFYLTDTKKYVIKTDNIQGDIHYQDPSCDPERFAIIANWVISTLSYYDPQIIYIEDYAYRAKGRVFHIAENTGIMKYYLYRAKWKYEVMSPSHIKKCASGKGNADKEAMHVAFQKETGVDLKSLILPTKKLGSPVTDIVDSFYVLKSGLATYTSKTQEPTE